jgi:hypothetical protein
LSTGANNTALGFQALNAVTIGVQNTAVGTLAGTTFNTSNNTMIGYNASAGNFSGSVVLGSGATGTAANQFVVGSAGVNAGAVTAEANVSANVWNVIINGVAQKILLA